MTLKFNFRYFFKTKEALEKDSKPYHLRRNYLFEDVQDDELCKLEKICYERKFKSGDRIFFKGKSADAVFLILSGSVSISCSTSEHVEKEIVLLNPGEFFGEAGLLEGTVRMGTATANEETRILAIMRDDFKKFVTQHPSAGTRILLRLIDVLGKRLMKANETLISLTSDAS